MKSQLAPQEADVDAAQGGVRICRRGSSTISRSRPACTACCSASARPDTQVERGAQVGPGTNLARVANPSMLKAELRIAETQTKDIRIGQYAEVDTRNGVVKGKVSRIDPASSNGTVGVDIMLEGALPPGARPDLSVDGDDSARAAGQRHLRRPPGVRPGEQHRSSLFKVGADGEAVRTR